jgi:hypothetical protein
MVRKFLKGTVPYTSVTVHVLEKLKTFPSSVSKIESTRNERRERKTTDLLFELNKVNYSIQNRNIRYVSIPAHTILS